MSYPVEQQGYFNHPPPPPRGGGGPYAAYPQQQQQQPPPPPTPPPQQYNYQQPVNPAYRQAPPQQYDQRQFNRPPQQQVPPPQRQGPHPPPRQRTPHQHPPPHDPQQRPPMEYQQRPPPPQMPQHQQPPPPPPMNGHPPPPHQKPRGPPPPPNQPRQQPQFDPRYKAPPPAMSPHPGQMPPPPPRSFSNPQRPASPAYQMPSPGGPPPPQKQPQYGGYPQQQPGPSPPQQVVKPYVAQNQGFSQSQPDLASGMQNMSLNDQHQPSPQASPRLQNPGPVVTPYAMSRSASPTVNNPRRPPPAQVASVPQQQQQQPPPQQQYNYSNGNGSANNGYYGPTSPTAITGDRHSEEQFSYGPGNGSNISVNKIPPASTVGSTTISPLAEQYRRDMVSPPLGTASTQRSGYTGSSPTSPQFNGHGHPQHESPASSNESDMINMYLDDEIKEYEKQDRGQSADSLPPLKPIGQAYQSDVQPLRSSNHSSHSYHSQHSHHSYQSRHSQQSDRSASYTHHPPAAPQPQPQPQSQPQPQPQQQYQQPPQQQYQQPPQQQYQQPPPQQYQPPPQQAQQYYNDPRYQNAPTPQPQPQPPRQVGTPVPQNYGPPQNQYQPPPQHQYQQPPAAQQHIPAHHQAQPQPLADQKPVPQRQYSQTSGSDPLTVATLQAKNKEELTVDEFEHIREQARSQHHSPQAQFQLAKKLSEAAEKLADKYENPSTPSRMSHVDSRTARKNADTWVAQAYKITKKLVQNQYPDAMFYMASAWSTGRGELGVSQPMFDKAYDLYHKAAKLDHAEAAYRVAVCHEYGSGTKKDIQKALVWYKRAATKGDCAAMYKLGMISLRGDLGQQKSFAEAITWLERAAGKADGNTPHAVHELGLLYEKADNLDMTAVNAMGTGTVIQRDERKAFDLFLKAAKLGYPPSQFRLGCCYEYGTLGCPIDPKRSIAWYSRAAEKDEPESELALSGWYLTGSDGVLQQSDTEAYLWARKAAEKGLAKAEYALGYFSEIGIGVKASAEEARRWYMKASGQGHPKARSRLQELSQK